MDVIISDIPISPKNQKALQNSTEAQIVHWTIRLALNSGSTKYLLPES